MPAAALGDLRLGFWVLSLPLQAREGAGPSTKCHCHCHSWSYGFREAVGRLSAQEAAHQQFGVWPPAGPRGRPWENSLPLPPFSEHRQERGERHPFPIPMCLDPAHRWHFFSMCQCKSALLPLQIPSLGSEGRGSPSTPPQAGGRRTGDPQHSQEPLPQPAGAEKNQPQTSP